MTAAALLLVVLVLTVAAALGRPTLTFSVLVGSTLLLPATLLVPRSPSAIITCTRVVLAGVVVGVVLLRRSEPLPRMRMPAALVLLLLFLGLIALTGVGLADPLTDPVSAAYSWTGQAEAAVVLVLAVELARRLPAGTVLVVLASGVTLAAAVGVLEAVTHASFARWLFQAAPEQLETNPAAVLEVRAGELRVRGALDFALAYGWVLAALLPSVALLHPVLRRRHSRLVALLPLTAVPLLLAGVVYSRSRSPLVGALVVAGVLVLVLAPRNPLARLGVVAAAVGVLYEVAPQLSSILSPNVDVGSIDVRVERLPDVLQLAAQRPLQGAGLTSIGRLGLGGVDSSYVLTYVESGVLSVVLLVGAMAAAILTVARALPGEKDGDQALVLAAVLGMVTLAAGALTFDVFSVGASERLFWLLCGVGVAASRRRCGPERLRSARSFFSVVSVLAVALATCVGLLVRSLAPEHSQTEIVFSTLSAPIEVLDDPPGLGRTLVTTVCQTAREVVQPGTSWRVASCSEIKPSGWGRMRLVGSYPIETEQAALQVFSRSRALPGLGSMRIATTAVSPETGLPTVAQVAPEVMGTAAAILLLLPTPRRRRDDR